jgi:hypothetical protein
MVLIQPFPQPGRLVRLAYRELDLAASRQQDHLLPLRDLASVPRPWYPATCRTPQLRKEVWSWLEAVVTWLNHEYVWDVGDVIPPCWPQHPHLVHEIAVLADQRRRAGQALTSEPLEEWHRYSLPSFTERMRTRLRKRPQRNRNSGRPKVRQWDPGWPAWQQDTIGSVILRCSSRRTKWMVIMPPEVITARASAVCVAGISLVASGIAAQLPIVCQSTLAG